MPSQRSSKYTSPAGLWAAGAELGGVSQQPTCVVPVMVGIENEINLKAPAGTQLLEMGLCAEVATGQHEEQVSHGSQWSLVILHQYCTLAGAGCVNRTHTFP